ncbi:hypothetical protein [Microbulbifer taiwanensis]
MATSFSVFAASDGTVDSVSSTGTSEITLTVGNLIVARMFGDIGLTTDGATVGSPITQTEEICIGFLGFTGYTVQLDSANGTAGTGTYTLDNGTETISYDVAFDDDETAGSGTSPNGTGAVPGTFTNNGNLGCSSENARIFISIPAAQWEGISSTASFTDTLTVTVSGS